MGPSVERIMLCMDDAARRRAFADALSESGALEVVGWAVADERGVRAVAARQPGIVIVQARRPGVEGAKLVGRLRAVAPRCGVMAMAAAQERPRSIVARSLVADRYVEPGVGPEELVARVEAYARERRGGREAS